MQRRTPDAPRPGAEAGRSRRGGLTTRAAVLAVALCAVLLTLAVPLQQYVAQRGQLSSLSEQAKAQARRVAALQHARQRWDDPAYIRQEARSRLHYVKPGETAFVVVAPTPTAAPRPTAHSGSGAVTHAGPWYSQLWKSVVDAGSATTTAKAPTAPVRRHVPRPIHPRHSTAGG